MSRNITVLEGIVEDIQRAVFQKWANELPEDQRTEEVLEPLAANASEIVLFVIQMYMDKINEAADQLKDS